MMNDVTISKIGNKVAVHSSVRAAVYYHFGMVEFYKDRVEALVDKFELAISDHGQVNMPLHTAQGGPAWLIVFPMLVDGGYMCEPTISRTGAIKATVYVLDGELTANSVFSCDDQLFWDIESAVKHLLGGMQDDLYIDDCIAAAERSLRIYGIWRERSVGADKAIVLANVQGNRPIPPPAGDRKLRNVKVQDSKGSTG